ERARVEDIFWTPADEGTIGGSHAGVVLGKVASIENGYDLHVLPFSETGTDKCLLVAVHCAQLLFFFSDAGRRYAQRPIELFASALLLREQHFERGRFFLGSGIEKGSSHVVPDFTGGKPQTSVFDPP